MIVQEQINLFLFRLFDFLSQYFSHNYTKYHVLRRIKERTKSDDPKETYKIIYNEIVNFHSRNLILVTKDKTFYYKLKIGEENIYPVRQKFNRKNKVIQTILTEDQMNNVIRNNKIIWRKNESFS